MAGTPTHGSVSYPYPPKEFKTLFDEFPGARLLETPVDDWRKNSGQVLVDKQLADNGKDIGWGEQTYTFWNIVFDNEEDAVAYELMYGEEVGLREDKPAILTVWDYF